METCHSRRYLSSPLNPLMGPLGFVELALGFVQWSRDDVVTGLRVGESGFRISAREKDFSVSQKRSDRIWGFRSRPFNGYWGSFPGVERPEYERDNPHPVPRLREAIPLLPLYVFMAYTGTVLHFLSFV